MMKHCYIVFAVLVGSTFNKPVSHLNHIYLFKTTEMFLQKVTTRFLANSLLYFPSADISISVLIIMQGIKDKYHFQKVNVTFLTNALKYMYTNHIQHFL